MPDIIQVVERMDQIIASNIKRLRKMRGFSQEELAAAADLNTAHLSQIETCRRKPRQGTINALSKALGVQPKVLHMDYSETLRPTPEEALAVITEAIKRPALAIPPHILNLLGRVEDWPSVEAFLKGLVGEESDPPPKHPPEKRK